ncbi:hypothetical protein HG530_000818 [Fusarium avenaceum]|nr:hypothetical protein HG530_000818 [Fusarium avenaceum]
MQKHITTGISCSKVFSDLETRKDNLAFLPQRIEKLLYFLFYIWVAVTTHDVQLEVEPSSVKLLCRFGEEVEAFLTSNTRNRHKYDLAVGCQVLP